jgi:hypothetical protein
VFVALAAVLLMSAPASASAWWTVLPSEVPETPIAEWEPREGDAFLVDTKENIGYLVHADLGYTSFPLVTGQRRWVRYIGRSYNATTPERQWVATSIDTKGDLTTFGLRGTFIRMQYKDEDTPYGIHSHRYVDVMMARDERYGSMGCIIVTDAMLDVLLATFEKNGNTLAVRTVYGLGEEGVNFVLLQTLIKNEA